MMSEKRAMKIEEENRRIRFLRFLVDFSILAIQQEKLSPLESLRVVEDVKRAACGLPGRKKLLN